MGNSLCLLCTFMYYGDIALNYTRPVKKIVTKTAYNILTPQAAFVTTIVSHNIVVMFDSFNGNVNKYVVVNNCYKIFL